MTGTRVWWYFFAFFGLIAGVNAVMITLALRTHSGVVSEHPYEAGLAYNRVVAAEQKQEALGWKGTIRYDKCILHFDVRGQHNGLITPDTATATFTRPTQAGMDFSIPLQGSDTPITFPAKGAWEVQIDAVSQGVHYQKRQRMMVE
jgi:nitrogen fixation protein FixH